MKKIIFDDDSFIICTDDHKFLLKNNNYLEVKNIKKVSGFLGSKGTPVPVSDKEIEKSKTQLRSATLMATESTMSNAAIAVHQIFTKEKLINIEETLEKIKNVSKSSIEKAAKKLLSSKPTISSIGPIQQLEYLDNIAKRLN